MKEKSPVTGVLEEDQVFIEEGEHGGKSILEIADTEPGFYEYLIQQRQSGQSFLRRQTNVTFYLCFAQAH